MIDFIIECNAGSPTQRYLAIMAVKRVCCCYRWRIATPSQSVVSPSFRIRREARRIISSGIWPSVRRRATTWVTWRRAPATRRRSHIYVAVNSSSLTTTKAFIDPYLLRRSRHSGASTKYSDVSNYFPFYVVINLTDLPFSVAVLS